LDPETLPVGAASFFAAILQAEGLHPQPRHNVGSDGNVLLISASASEYSRLQIEAMRDRGVPVFTMPAAVDNIAAAFQSSPHVIVAARSSQPLIDLAEQLLDRIHYLWIEGGATASALIRRLGWETLDVVEELAPGVVSLRRPGLAGPVLVLKPGSYSWPDAGQW
jgi:uncharacterized protein YgbK (DUF1537 family)